MIAGGTATFTVIATGDAPLSYQWKKDGTDIAGATSASLTINNAQESDEGSYTVVVSNGAGNVTSTAATLTVTPAPVAPTITTEPSDQTVTAGGTATFTVIATGDAPLSYQWKKDGIDIAGATSASLTINNAQETDEGSYTVVVTNAAGNVTSTAATLTVTPAPVAPMITTEPSDQTVTAGGTATFTVIATGDAPLSYQWKKDGIDITGATSATLTINNAQEPDEGSYTVVVTNAAGNVTSTAATLTVTPAPVAPTITTEPSDQTVTVGGTVTFTVIATGDAPLSYQWKKDGIDIAGATSASLTINNAQEIDEGSYTVVVSNGAGNVTSTAATLTVTPAPVAPAITTEPSDQTVTAGGTATFTVIATGDAPLSYQWKKDGIDIAGATSASLTINNAQESDEGSYTVVVSNGAGNVTSTAATLTVTPAPVAPTITTEPSDQTVTVGGTVTFTVIATGDAPLSYQ
ncbi:immunoglobulin I-set domain-containing protein, partial [Schinkia azotoformans MEV2011]